MNYKNWEGECKWSLFTNNEVVYVESLRKSTEKLANDNLII